MQNPLPLIIDTDNAFGIPVRDIDDGVALAMAFASEDVAVKGIVASACNCRALEAAQCTRAMLEVFGRTEIPLGLGSETPMGESREPHHLYLEKRTEELGATYWPKEFEPCDTGALVDGPELMISLLKESPEPVTLLCLGSFTNLAMALAKAPDVAANIASVVHLGGSFTPKPGEQAFVWEPADHTQGAFDNILHFNTWYDRKATARVIESGVPLTFISANVTCHFFLRPEHLKQLHEVGAGPIKSWLLGGMDPWMAWSMERRKLCGSHMHDPLALQAVLEPELLTYRRMAADVDGFLSGGELLVDAGLASGPHVKVAVDVDYSRAESMMVSLLEKAMA